MAQARSPCGGGHALGAGRTHRDYTGSCSRPASRRCEWRPRPRSTTSSKHAEFCPWGETHGGSLGSEGRLDDTLDGVTVTDVSEACRLLDDAAHPTHSTNVRSGSIGGSC
jgi:hypothetical protein